MQVCTYRKSKKEIEKIDKKKKRKVSSSVIGLMSSIEDIDIH